VRVLVTGGHGFVGSHLVERLLAAGADVRATSRILVPERLRGLALEVVAGDLETSEGLRAALQGCRGLAPGALTAAAAGARSAVNTLGTLRLAREARRRAPRPVRVLLLLPPGLASGRRAQRTAAQARDDLRGAAAASARWVWRRWAPSFPG
jgi:nucleoside-diphosphate-sugar epimerase